MTGYPVFIVTPTDRVSKVGNVLGDVTAFLAENKKSVNTDGSWKLETSTAQIVDPLGAVPPHSAIELLIDVDCTPPNGILLQLFVAAPPQTGPGYTLQTSLRPYIKNFTTQNLELQPVTINLPADSNQQQAIWIYLDLPVNPPPPPFCIQMVLVASDTAANQHDFDFYGATGELI